MEIEKKQLDKEVSLYESMMAGYTQDLAKISDKYKVKEEVVNPDNDDKRKLSDKEKQKKLKIQLKEKEAAAAKEEANIKARYARGEIAYRDYCKAINENDIKELDAKMSLYDEESNEYNQLLSKKQDLLKAGLEQETKFTIEEIEARTKAEEIDLVSSYNERKISRYALNEGLFQLDMEALQQKQALYTKDSKEWHEYEKQIVDLENNEKLRKQQAYQELLASIRDEYSKKNLDQLMNEELDGIDLLHNNGLLKEEEYQKLRKAIQVKYLKEKIDQVDEPEGGAEGISTEKPTGDWQKLKDKYALIEDAEKRGTITHQQALQQKAEADAKYLDNLKAQTEVLYSSLSSMVSAYSDYASACQDLEVAKVEKKYDAEIEAAGSSTTKGKKLEEQKQKEVAKIKTKYNKKAMQIEIAQAFASTAMSAINAYSSAAEVPLIGYILAPIAAASALAAGMLQIATIKKQHQAQEAGYYSGGFTAQGDYRKEVGVVHAGEFVADHRAVNNASLLPVLRLIDNAQKNNTIGSLTTADVSRALGGTSSLSSVGNDNTKSGMDNEALVGMLGYTYTVIEKLEKRLEAPFITVNTVDGEHGIKQAMDKYEQTIKIKSR